ncbi:hypothetical protein [Endozoicomonas sp. SESOKO1]|nr:hypothetical protein [Endozoicomonas sp. SESOKO1]
MDAFLFVQQSGQARQAERSLNHRLGGEERNPNGKGVAGQRQCLGVL